MSSKNHPFDAGNKTIIRPNPGRVRSSDAARPVETPADAQPASAEAPGATVFDPGAAQSPPAGWSSGTVIYQGTPFAEIATTGGSSFGGADRGQANPPARPGQKVPQDILLSAGDGIEYAAANPIIAAAAPLLMLLGHLRLMVAQTEAAPLAKYIADAIEEFERKIADAGIPAEGARIAKFALCETADDVIRNLPGPDRDTWMQHSMLSRFFQVGSPGVGFFKALNKILAAPEGHHELLELMHACLSLGFEGQYRGMAREDIDLQRVRRDVYETLRYFRERPDDEISPRWQGLSAMMARNSPGVPLWSIAAATLALLTGIFFALRVLITDEGDALADELLALNPSVPIVIERTSFVPLTAEVKPTTTQIDRVRAALAKEIEAGGLTVDAKGEFIVVEINNLVLFASGKADVKAEFDAIAGRIAAALEPEPGPIKIVGHTDNVKPRKSSAFKSNYDLSVARAKAVEKMLAPKVSDPSRIVVEGKGEDEPIADNATPEGRAKNRRVDLMIPREETL
jgi:type VI secretion system protein ImpK